MGGLETQSRGVKALINFFDDRGHQFAERENNGSGQKNFKLA